MRTFLILWFSQTVSAFGSGLTRFALGVWVYQTTGSVTRFALILLVTLLPGLLVSPLAGALVDRWERRRAMLLSDAGAGLCTLTLAVLIALERLELWHVYAVLGLSSIFQALQWPAFTAASTLLVAKAQLGRVAGLRQAGTGTADIAAPVAAAVLLGHLRLEGILLIDVLTFLGATATLLVLRQPQPQPRGEAAGEQPSLLREIGDGWSYLLERPALLRLLGLFFAANLVNGTLQVLIIPLVLSLGTTASLGVVLGLGQAGFLLGSFLMVGWGGPRRRMPLILGGLLVQGLLLFLALGPRLVLVAILYFFYLFLIPVVTSCSQAIWQVKTAPDVQGRVFALRRMIAFGAAPLAYLASGPLADRVFGPLLADKGPLALSLGAWIGTSPGRGMALMLGLSGALLAAIASLGWRSSDLREMEERLPDALDDV